MKRRLIGFVIVLIFFSTHIISVKAIEYKPGCKVGDWIELVIRGGGSNLSEEDFYKQVPERYRVDVINVSNTSVKAKFTEFYRNGTKYVSYHVFDVVFGYVDGYKSFYPFIIAGNLEAGLPIHRGSDMVINRTETTKVGGAYGVEREVVVLELNYTIPYAHESFYFLGKWDKETGFRIYFYYKLIFSNTTRWIEIKTSKASFIEGVGLSSTQLTLLMAPVLAAVVVGIIFYMRRRRK